MKWRILLKSEDKDKEKEIVEQVFWSLHLK